jgi:hypothetical protein
MHEDIGQTVIRLNETRTSYLAHGTALIRPLGVALRRTIDHGRRRPQQEGKAVQEGTAAIEEDPSLHRTPQDCEPASQPAIPLRGVRE